MGHHISYIKINDTFKETMGLEIWQVVYVQKTNWNNDKYCGGRGRQNKQQQHTLKAWKS